MQSQNQNTDIQTTDSNANRHVHVPSESSEEKDGFQDSDESPTSEKDYVPENHPYKLYIVNGYDIVGFVEAVARILVIATTEEECCDILEYKYSGTRHDIETAVKKAKCVRLADPDHSSCILMSIIH